MNPELTHLIIYHSLLTAGELLVIFILGHMLYKRRSPTSIISWLLFIILAPYIAVVLYFIFGSRKRQNRYKKNPITLKKRAHRYQKENPINEVLRGYGIADAVRNESFELYTDSVKAYDALMESINNAQRSIYIGVYIFEYDDVTQNIIQALIKKAKAGVEVKILLDSLGSLGFYLLQGRLKKLKKAGVQIQFFMPLFEMPFRNYINLRNHRKIYIFDNKKVLSGGMNLSNEYLGPDTGEPRWEDILFLVEGSSVELYFEIFASDWFYASQQTLTFNADTPVDRGNTYLQIVPSGPDMHKDVLYGALLCAIYDAKERIWIVTPYFVPDASLVQALIIAKHRGVDVQLITPKKSHYLIVDLTRSSYMRELEEAGIKVALYEGVLLHAKAIIFDNTSAMLGSVNIDNRSLFLNYEVATFVYSKKVITDIQEWMSQLLKNSSTGIQNPSAPRRIAENLMRIFAPQL
jgi:cardiolipin synthase A/B